MFPRLRALRVSVSPRRVSRMRTARLGPFEVSIPQTRRERRRGLLGTRCLPPGHGLLLERCRSVHTVGMRYAIDAVLLDRRWRVVRVLTLAPGRVLRPRRGIRHVLEVAAGAGPRVGRRLSLSPPAPGSPATPDDPCIVDPGRT
ncbi:MAG: DUF192 domain-containing protein [Actinomycetota bacterium]